MTVPTLTPEQIADIDGQELAERGWKTVIVTDDQGRERRQMIPLTPEEFLHPEEGYRLPNSTFHDDVATDVRDILARRYAGDPTVGVFRDLLILWDDEAGTRHSPDVCVVFGLQNKGENRERFEVATEGARPRLVIEIVSRRYRKEDRVDKVVEYERFGVQEYVILDRRRLRGQFTDEVIGYELVEGRYRPLLTDDQNRLLCQTVGVWISLRDGKVALEDAATGERLLTSSELQALVQTERSAREAAEARARELEARLKALEEQSR